jgi:hypothetical protein
MLFIQLQQLARCEKDDFSQKGKGCLPERNPYFLHELNELLPHFIVRGM